MKILATLLALLLASPAKASDPLEFSARIKSEVLAEEAIDLLHCVSDRLGIPWELGEGGRAPNRMALSEKEGKLEGRLIAPGFEKAFTLGQGESQTACNELLPLSAPENLSPDFSESYEPPPASSKKWIWLIAASAALAGGFFLWKARQPAHRSFTMD